MIKYLVHLYKIYSKHFQIHITPLEDLIRYKEEGTGIQVNSIESTSCQSSNLHNYLNEPSEMLSRTLKRKFTELDEITQRLRLRLSKVTEEYSDASSDGFTDQFENDINTLCVEEDFDLINFEEESKSLNKLNLNETSEDNNSNLLVTDNQNVVEANDSKESLNFESTSEGSLSTDSKEGKFKLFS